ncbi:hypothetical protein HDV64DRAFT_60828 [Trichoderma sp. TUCIM 5745]
MRWSFFLATPVARAARGLNISQTNESTPRLCHTTPDPAQGHRPPPSPGLLCGFPPPSTSQPSTSTPPQGWTTCGSIRTREGRFCRASTSSVCWSFKDEVSNYSMDVHKRSLRQGTSDCSRLGLLLSDLRALHPASSSSESTSRS